jgi:4-hydroxybenzoate polyprenyltransferase/phosphoserine phosphatase
MIQKVSDPVSIDDPEDQTIPLCVDLDGTLIRTDMLWESLLIALGKPLVLLKVLGALFRGKAAVKEVLARSIVPDPKTLPYREDLVEWLIHERARGRTLVLATATHEAVATPIAEHLGLFHRVMASHAQQNLGGKTKRNALTTAFGSRGFDYVGDHPKDAAVFAEARRAHLADPSPSLRKAAARVSTVGREFAGKPRPFKTLRRTLRIHQWAKNALIGVPLVTAHLLGDLNSWVSVALAFGAFSILASATYIINDLHDLSVDRIHQKKKFRPLAHGDLSIPAGLALSLFLAAIAFTVSFLFLPRLFLGALVLYTVLTLAYSLSLKRKAIVDALTLAALYTLRIVAGAVAIGVTVTEWLGMFSVFLFVSLALIKRYVELDGLPEGKIPGRGYQPSDMDVIMASGVTSGMMAALILAFYISGPTVTNLYPTPVFLWLLCPLVFYWITRMWFLAKRGFLHHDPIVFALKDKRSYVVAVLAALLMVAASINWSWLGLL